MARSVMGLGGGGGTLSTLFLDKQIEIIQLIAMITGQKSLFFIFLGQHMATWLACHCMVTYFSFVQVIIW